jgi:hypothetical protein
MLPGFACSSSLDLGPPSDPDPPRVVLITLTNLDDVPVSLLMLPDDTLPCCMLDPGQTRNVEKGVAGGGSIEFAAAQNEAIVARITCVAEEAFNTRRATVAWGEGHLSCLEW